MTETLAKTRDKRVKPRFKIEVQARIKAQLIGSSSKFPFITENISESGLLIAHPPGSRHFFNTHSILEVWLLNDEGEEIYFFAKYVRKAGENAFAIKIIDIDGTNSKKYREFLELKNDLEMFEEPELPEEDSKPE